MKVVLDSTALRADHHMDGTHFKLFFDGLASIPASLLVPAVVIDEVVNGYREWLEREKRSYYRQIDELARIVPGRTKDKPPIDVELHAATYRSQLEAKIKEHGQILPYPATTHDQVVARALTRKKPFAASGAGYRDYLIWETLRSQRLSGSEQLVFITRNTTDFGTDSLHPDLAGEILNPSRVKVVRELADFNRAFIAPRLKVAEALKIQLQNGKGPFDVDGWVRLSFLDVIHDDALLRAVTSFPSGVGSAHPLDVVQFMNISILDVGEMTSGDTFVRVEVIADVEVSVDVDGHDYANNAEARDWVGSPLGELDFSSSNHTIRLVVVIDLTVDASTGVVSSHFLENIEMAQRATEVS